MTIKQLMYFSEIYEAGSLSQAAQQLYISQQALSRILSTLEQELGAQLFYRTRRGILPTALGTELFQACQPLLEENRKLEKHVREFVRLSSGHLNVGLAAGARYLNSGVLWEAFQNHYPQMSVSAEECPYLDGLAALHNRTLDVLTFSDYDPGDDYCQCPLRTWHRVLISPPGHRTYEKKTVTPQDLKGERLILSANPMVHQQLVDLCREMDCMPAQIIRVSDTMYMYETCQTEGCIGITIRGYFSNVFIPVFSALRLLPFQEEFLPYTVSAIYRRDHPMAKIISFLTDFLGQSLKDAPDSFPPLV